MAGQKPQVSLANLGHPDWLGAGLEGGEDGWGWRGCAGGFFCCGFFFFLLLFAEFAQERCEDAFSLGGRLNFGFGGKDAVSSVGGDFLDGLWFGLGRRIAIAAVGVARA